ncbi:MULTISPECIES: class I SAM-dependent methyltransferase [Halobacterium]|uniref:class I SAM-dependent methyltransferase n=1 Tax=Halobacterium TaxID=2239 RepID=UPI00073ED9C4|nr:MULTISPECIES: class I SAM-dependent methyltransferase [Halobacterium]MCG1003416.1 class I SAM-dependent methyltransferase [Halobacterium noricense]
MKKTVDEHAARFDELAASYDDEKSAEYNECVALVLEHAAPDSDDTVLDLGCGTGAIALGLAEDAGRVVGRDISEGMMDEARRKADERGFENVEFGEGQFREPNFDGDVDAGSAEPPRADARDASVDIVTSNFAMHHLSDAEKREAISVIAGLGPRRIVLGDVMFFGEPDPEEPFYSPEVDDPATVGVLADAFTDEGYALTAVEMVHEQVGVLVAERQQPQ